MRLVLVLNMLSSLNKDIIIIIIIIILRYKVDGSYEYSCSEYEVFIN